MHEKERCGDFIRGVCTRGDGCRYSHDEPSKPICRDFLKGHCTRGDGCKFSHEEEPAEECRDYKQGRCTRDACRFAHNDTGDEAGSKRVRGTSDDEDNTKKRTKTDEEGVTE